MAHIRRYLIISSVNQTDLFIMFAYIYSVVFILHQLTQMDNGVDDDFDSAQK